MTKSFHNTIGAAGQRLLQFDNQARSQEARIYNYLVSKPWEWFTPTAVQLILFSERTPITSVRRAITNLEKQGKIEKSPSANAMGPYGKQCHTWRYKPE